MGPKVDEVVDQAMRMSPEDRAQVVQRLIRSLEDVEDLQVEAAWQQEAQRRAGELVSGAARPVKWEDVRRKLRKDGRADH